jgi:hypothetical protein
MRLEAFAGFTQTQRTVWTAANLVSIVIVLPVIFPKAHGADFKGSARV